LKSILIVEDDCNLQNFYKSFIEISFKELKLFQAFNGEEALASCSKVDHSVILSDIEMPNIGGIEFYQTLKEKQPELSKRMAFISGSISGKNLSYIREERRPYLLKPHRLEPFKDLIRSIIAGEEEQFIFEYGHKCKRRFPRTQIRESCQLNPITSAQLLNEPLITETINYSEGGVAVSYTGLPTLSLGEKCIVDIKALDITDKAATVAWAGKSENTSKAGLMWI
jgi:DNA-binding NarL/FixJ family response regulator